MPHFGHSSQSKLDTCHPELISVFNEVIKSVDCSILEGNRSMERQKMLFREGSSKTLGSKHLAQPSLAVDVSPYPTPEDWGEYDSKALAEFYYFAGYVKAIADGLNIKIRWGGDWDGDSVFTDQTFDDLVHFELR